MNIKTVAEGNALFYLVGVGMCLGISEFAGVALECLFWEEGHYPTDNVGKPGYIKFNLSVVQERPKPFQEKFAEAIRAGIFTRVSYGFSSRTQFDGDLCEGVTITKDGYEFSFYIRQYERDSEHGFEIIDPEALSDIPESEELGRVVWLTIKPIE